MNLERRSCAFVERQNSDELTGRFTGYGSTYSLDLVGDRIQPGAFTDTISHKGGKVPIFLNHSAEVWAGHTLSLVEDKKGLKVEAQLFTNTSAGRDAWELLRAADSIDVRVGMSIGFVTEDADWEGNTRLIKKIDLWEISITPFPANPKSLISELKTVRDFEAYLRDVEKLSKADARRIASALAVYNQRSGGTPDAQSPLSVLTQALARERSSA